MQSCVKFLPDYATQENPNAKALYKVGIEEVWLYRLDFNEERVLTEQSAFVGLKKANGIHMSRLAEILYKGEGEVIELDDDMLEEIALSHDIMSSYWECKWESIYKADEVSMKVGCKIEGKYFDEETKWFLTLGIPYTSVCPCSAAMVKEHGGIPHMQRAKAVITGLLPVGTRLEETITLLIGEVCDVVGLIPQPIMKRKDELVWCQRAEKKNLFVEDAARVIGDTVDEWFDDWSIVCTHFESIHQHNAVAICRKGEELS